jgi:hypothetical protein
MEQFLRELGPTLPVLQYSDTCHPIKGQYPGRNWHWALAFVYGRSSINPLAMHTAGNPTCYRTCHVYYLVPRAGIGITNIVSGTLTYISIQQPY